MKLNEFIKVMTGQLQSIQVRLNESAMQLVARSHRKLHSIVETILFCGQQNILFLGHRDSGLDVDFMLLHVIVISGHC